MLGRHKTPAGPPIRPDQVRRLANAGDALMAVADGADPDAPTRRRAEFRRAEAVCDAVDAASSRAERKAARMAEMTGED